MGEREDELRNNLKSWRRFGFNTSPCAIFSLYLPSEGAIFIVRQKRPSTTLKNQEFVSLHASFCPFSVFQGL